MTIVGDTTCGGTSGAAPTLASVVDQPLTSITVSTTPVNAGTQSTVQCAGETTAAAAPHTTGTYVPGTYTCTIVIDP